MSAAKLRTALLACMHFIENVSEDDPQRTDKFFALREQWREALYSPAPRRLTRKQWTKSRRLANVRQFMKDTWVGMQEDPECIGAAYVEARAAYSALALELCKETEE